MTGLLHRILQSQKEEKRTLRSMTSCPFNYKEEDCGSEFPSMLLMEIESYLLHGYRAFVFDMNGFFAPQCAPMGANSLSLCADMSLSINPYTNIPEVVSGDGKQIRNDMLSLLREIVLFMAIPSSDIHRMVMDQALNHAWLKEGSGASLDTIVEFIMKHNKTEGHKMGSRLLKYTSWDMCGSLFSGRSQLDLSGQFHAIDISQLWMMPSLKGIVIRYLLLAVFQEITKPFLLNGKQREELDAEKDVLGGVGGSSTFQSLFKDPQPTEKSVAMYSHFPTQTPFLIVINDSESMLTGDEARKFLKMYEDMIAKYQGKLLISHGKI